MENLQKQNNNIWAGIDNGIGGALSFYNSDTNELSAYPMPIISVPTKKGNKNQYNLPEIIRILKSHMPIKLCVLERAQAFPGSAVQATFSFARTFGQMEGILSALEIPYRIVAPQSWMADMFRGIPHKKGESKQASILVAQRLFPKTHFIASNKATKIHDGMTDATLMAVYATKL